MSSRLFVGLGALLAGCDVKVTQPDASVVDECEGLPVLTVTAAPAVIRVNSAATLTATGGSGRTTFSVAAGGSGGEVIGDRFVSGPTPAMDRLTAADDCGNQATTTLEVRAAFSVAPTHATVRPGTSFVVTTTGLLGMARFTPQAMPSGGTIAPDGRYTAGAMQALDLIEVEDTGTGEQAVLQFRVSSAATFRASPAKLALPSGASVPLEVEDGSGVVQWTKASGPGTVTGSTFTSADGDTGTAVLNGTDQFTTETTTVTVRVLEELKRGGRPHGRVTDVASIVTGDFDGDGVKDVAVGVPESDLAKPAGGAVFVFKGAATGLPATPTWVITGETDTSQLGAVMAAGDLDGDGKDDLAISAPGADITGADSGAVLLYRFTADGPKRMRDPISGLTRNALFGAAIAIADADGDGDEDLIVGGPGSDLAPTNQINSRGIVDVFLAVRGEGFADQGSIRLGGWDTAGDGTFRATTNLRFGRSLAVGDLNGDGRADIASLGAMTPPAGDGGVLRSQPSIAVHFARDGQPRFPEKPDLYVLPSNLADSDEGNGRLQYVAADNGKPALLMISLERADSPNLTAMDAGTAGGTNAGGTLFFDLTGRPATGGPVTMPAFVQRTDAAARIYGDQANIQAGRSFAVADVDGAPGLELVLGAPYAPMPMGATNAGKLLVFPLGAMTAGTVANRPVDFRGGARGAVLGTAVAVWAPGTARGLVALASRATTQHGDFTGRVDALLGSGPLAGWAVSGAELPAKLASEQFGLAVRVGATAGKVRALVGAPGFSGPDSAGLGGDTQVGQAVVYELGQGASATLVHEGAINFYRADGGTARFGGRASAFDVALTDFDGDGRQDFAVATPGFTQPTATNMDYARLDGDGGCLAGSTLGGVTVHTVAADGTAREAFRVWAGAAIPNCDAGSCTRAALSRFGIAGGFDFDNDGLQDLAVTRTNGLEVFSGRALDDPTLARLTAACGPVYSLPSTPAATYGPVPLGDLDGDGCDEVAVRYGTVQALAEPLVQPAGIVIVFGASAAGACGTHLQPTFVRISGEPDVGLNSMQLGSGVAYAGRVLGDTRRFVAVSARVYPYLGVGQPVVLLFDVAQLLGKRPAAGGVLVGAVGDGLTPIPVMYKERAPALGRALIGNVDLTGDGIVDLVVSAPGANVNGDGTGAVFVFAGGAALQGPRPSVLTVVGDHRERGLFGQDVSVSPASGGLPTVLGVGAPTSYRSGTANGAAFITALDF